MRGVYEVDLECPVPDQRMVQHVRALDPADALVRLAERGSPYPITSAPRLVRTLRPHEPLVIVVNPGDLPTVVQ